MQRIIVDLPEPEGPHTTIFSPRVTLRFTSFRTWNSPYHLCTPIISTAVSVFSVVGFRFKAAMMVLPYRLSATESRRSVARA